MLHVVPTTQENRIHDTACWVGQSKLVLKQGMQRGRFSVEGSFKPLVMMLLKRCTDRPENVWVQVFVGVSGKRSRFDCSVEKKTNLKHYVIGNMNTSTEYCEVFTRMVDYFQKCCLDVVSVFFKFNWAV